MNRRGRRLIAPVAVRLSGARVIALAATTAIHVLALAGILMAPAPPSGGAADETRPLVVITLRPPPASPKITPEGARKKIDTSLSRHTPQPELDGSVSVQALPDQPPALALQQFESQPKAAVSKTQPAPATRDTADLLADYKTQLWRHIDAHRPRGVKGSGTTLIWFQVASDGTLLSSQIARSSGNMLLDRIALKALRQAIPLPRPPTSLTADQLMFVIPLNFR